MGRNGNQLVATCPPLHPLNTSKHPSFPTNNVFALYDGGGKRRGEGREKERGEKMEGGGRG